MQEHILEDITQMLAKALRDTDERPEVKAEDHIINDLGLDSLQMLAFLLEVEQRFGLALDFENLDISHLGSVRDFAHWVGGLMSEQGVR
jgi:acyl carrier protein